MCQAVFLLRHLSKALMPCIYSIKNVLSNFQNLLFEDSRTLWVSLGSFSWTVAISISDRLGVWWRSGRVAGCHICNIGPNIFKHYNIHNILCYIHQKSFSLNRTFLFNKMISCDGRILVHSSITLTVDIVFKLSDEFIWLFLKHLCAFFLHGMKWCLCNLHCWCYC